ncbi:hypothetical protein [Sinorhizobium sp. 6-70]|uniref:hypothetical protein n=1 Tax=Sinorhizobium sp. 6-70 TaxID=3049088 RepID=UPI0034DEED66
MGQRDIRRMLILGAMVLVQLGSPETSVRRLVARSRIAKKPRMLVATALGTRLRVASGPC